VGSLDRVVAPRGENGTATSMCRIVRLVSFCVLLFPLCRRAEAARITEYTIPTPNGSPREIALGVDGRLWFTEYDAGKVGRITTAGEFWETHLATGARPVGIASLGRFALAIVSEGFGEVAVLSVLGGLDWPLLPILSKPVLAVGGPDGRIWVTPAEPGAPIFAYHWLSNSPANESFANPRPSGVLAGIALGADGRIWFTDLVNNTVGACNPEGGACVDWLVPTAGSEPSRIAAGHDGALWFTERAANKIGRVTTAGVFTEFPVPTAGSQPLGITAGSDGNMWFTEMEGNKIGRITPEGTITEFPIPTPASGPGCITRGPDGNIWFGERHAGKIGKLQVFIPGDVDGSGQVDVQDVFYLINFLFSAGPAPR
jgi:streptogramin lyase